MITGRIQDIAEQIMVVIKNNMLVLSVIDGLKRKRRISNACY
ncbi:hypothetical protein [Acetivibrio saccincola]|jgi:ATP-dependent DNA helicase RecG|uniref:Uncharacterized protein n=1 Tax=Acetivibrio saccincola TaxID=1677857 RepID=A0A2K9E0H9_9FIRM|nr:hypothetical protein [Acetivibrio saccincola]AUG57282.1 hypothetical protein HVS_06780 [Acetivibrio saccincola]HQD29853.1 hypothetical protein [Acetivibrio saccincola]